MTTGRLTRGLAAVTFAGVAVLGMSASALAQTSDYPPPPPGNSGGAPGQGETPPGQGETPPGQTPGFNCPNPAGNTPGACPRGAEVTMGAPADTFTPGSPVEGGVQSKYQKIADLTATSTGAASMTFKIPTNLSNGVHHTIFTGTKNGRTVRHRVPFTVEGSVAATSNRGRALPRTGSDDLVALSVAGGTMVLVGAGVVVAARRRRDEGFAAA